jgi:3-deoxy-D-manno-octulosonate 8-phosphate phosphatase (KDO 8-P phosphatase)
MTVTERASRIRLLLFDVDGVLTDGTVIVHPDGSDSKGFHIRDGAAIVWAQRAGIPVGIISARASAATTQRAAQLAIRIVAQGVHSKLAAFEQIVKEHNTDPTTIAYMGDDLLDLPVMARVGFAGAPADAAPEVREQAHWVSASGGGRGAVREFIEVILRARDLWSAVLAEFQTRA